MGRSAIDDQKDRAAGSGEQAFQKLDENSGVDAALLFDHEAHVTA